MFGQKTQLKHFIPQPKTLEDLKQAYKTLALKWHPDRGGDLEKMKEINNEYDLLFPLLKNIHKNKDDEVYEYKTENAETPEEFKDIIDKLIRFEGVKIEIIGAFIWLSENTRPYKEQIKEMGFKWSSNKISWYLAPDWYHKRSRRKYSLDDIRGMYGSQTVENDPYNKIA